MPAVLRRTFPLACIGAAAAAGLVIATGESARHPIADMPVATSPAAGFQVFRRAESLRDWPTAGATLAERKAGATARGASMFRSVYQDGDRHVYAFQRPGQVCLLVQVASGPDPASWTGCQEAAAAVDPQNGLSVTAGLDQDIALVPDAVTSVDLSLADGRVTKSAVVDNVVLAPRGATVTATLRNGARTKLQLP